PRWVYGATNSTTTVHTWADSAVAVPLQPADPGAAVGGGDLGPRPREVADPAVEGFQPDRRVGDHLGGGYQVGGLQGQLGRHGQVVGREHLLGADGLQLGQLAIALGITDPDRRHALDPQ